MENTQPSYHLGLKYIIKGFHQNVNVKTENIMNCKTKLETKLDGFVWMKNMNHIVDQLNRFTGYCCQYLTGGSLRNVTTVNFMPGITRIRIFRIERQLWSSFRLRNVGKDFVNWNYCNWKSKTVNFSELVCRNCLFKGSDRPCKVVKLSMLCCGNLLSGSFELYIKLFKICQFWVWAQIRRSKLLLWG